jgi:hypothetical protein
VTVSGQFSRNHCPGGTDSGSGESWFEPRRGNSRRGSDCCLLRLILFAAGSGPSSGRSARCTSARHWLPASGPLRTSCISSYRRSRCPCFCAPSVSGRRHSGGGSGSTPYRAITLIVALLFGPLRGTAATSVQANQPAPWLGVWQRINIAAYMVWIAVLAITLLRSRAPAGRHTAGELLQRQPWQPETRNAD